MKRQIVHITFETIILLLAIAASSLFIMALVSMPAACSQDEDEPTPPEPPEVENKQVFQIQIGNEQREYIVYVPSSYNENSDHPLVCHLHGGSGNGEKHYNISGWNEVAEENGFLVAYPTARAYNKSENGCQDNIAITLWNHYELKDEVCAEDDLQDDVVFLSQMMDAIGTNFSVDENKVYVSGFSNGGGMASRLAVELSDRLAAVALMSGTFKDTAATYIPKRMLPIHMALGTVDDRFAGKTGFANDTLPMDLDAVLNEPYVSSLMDIWNRSFELDSFFSVTDSVGTEITATRYGVSGESNHLMYFTLMENVGHVFHNPDDALGTAELFWEFFKNHSR